MEKVILIINGIEVRANVTKQFIKDNKEETKMIYKKILLQLGKIILNFGLSLMFNAVDKDGNGTLSKEEIHNFVAKALAKVYQKK